MRIGGNDSVLIGGTGLVYNAANLTTAINNISGFPGTVTVTGAAGPGFTITYGGASAGVDVPNVQLVELACGGCFASVQETNHGGAMDSFRLNYDGNVSDVITNGGNYSAAGIQAALLPIPRRHRDGRRLRRGHVQQHGLPGHLWRNAGQTNIPVLLGTQDFPSGASGFTGETDKGGPIDNGGTVTPTGNTAPVPTVPPNATIPLRTPFALTGSAVDAEGDPIYYSWEQNDIGIGAGQSLLYNVKTNGPLFAMFHLSAPVSEEDTLLYNSPNENHMTTSPTRVFPDLRRS